MQEIADRAGVNKAMLFYYYTNKDSLYAEVLRANMTEIISNIMSIIISEGDSENKIERIVQAYLTFFRSHPDLPKLVLREIANDGGELKSIVREIKETTGENIPQRFISLIEQSVAQQHFHDIDAKQTIISIVGMCIIYFIGKPFLEILLELEFTDEEDFIEQRMDNVIFILKNGLLRKSK